MTNQDLVIWADQNGGIGSPHLHKNGPIRNQGGTFIKSSLRGCFSGVNFRLLSEASFLWFANFSPE